jgi:hypothetical protein
VTVLEEAHNLLKNTSGSDSDLIGKSVEMITSTIAEIRTYGEGFIIVDQSPSSVDIAAIKNTNTKIVLRTPEANDREAVGRSMGLTPDQVNEIAKLPSGVAVVYQNDWITPVLTMVDKAAVKEIAYVPEKVEQIKPLRVARTELVRVILEPWLGETNQTSAELQAAKLGLELKPENAKLLDLMIIRYIAYGGHTVLSVEDLPLVKGVLTDILDLSKKKFLLLIERENEQGLLRFISEQTVGFDDQEVIEIANILTRSVEDGF